MSGPESQEGPADWKAGSLRSSKALLQGSTGEVVVRGGSFSVANICRESLAWFPGCCCLVTVATAVVNKQ